MTSNDGRSRAIQFKLRMRDGSSSTKLYDRLYNDEEMVMSNSILLLLGSGRCFTVRSLFLLGQDSLLCIYLYTLTITHSHTPYHLYLLL